jgi:hypothetical protein
VRPAAAGRALAGKHAGGCGVLSLEAQHICTPKIFLVICEPVPSEPRNQE